MCLSFNNVSNEVFNTTSLVYVIRIWHILFSYVLFQATTEDSQSKTGRPVVICKQAHEPLSHCPRSDV